MMPNLKSILLAPLFLLEVLAVPELAPGDGLRIAAIVPTKAGQIGINTVDIPPKAEITASIGVDTQYLTDLGGTSTKWIGVDPWFTETYVTTGKGPAPTAAPKPKGFLISVNDKGGFDIMLSKAVHDQLEAIIKEMPACALSKNRRRQSGDACAANALRFLGERINQNSQLSEQFSQLAKDLARYVGGEAHEDTLAAAKQLLAWIGDASLKDALAVLSEAGAFEPLTIGVIASFFGVTWMATDKLGHFDSFWKFTAKPSARPAPSRARPPNASGKKKKCPTREEGFPQCDANNCKGNDDGRCTIEGDYKDCECTGINFPIAYYLMSGWGRIEELLIHTDLNKPISGDLIPDCTRNEQVDVETKMFDKMFEQYCEKLGSALAPHIEVGRDFSAADLGSSGYRAWTFSVRWSGNGKEEGCSPDCKDVYKLFGTNTCSFTSHQKARKGTLNHPCGRATYQITPQKAPEIDKPICDVDTSGENTLHFLRDDAKEAVDRFCGALADENRWVTSERGRSYVSDKSIIDPGGSELPPNVKLELGLWIKRGEKHCGEGQDYKVSEGMNKEKCLKNFIKALDDCPPYVNVFPEKAKLKKYPARIYSDCHEFSFEVVRHQT